MRYEIALGEAKQSLELDKVSSKADYLRCLSTIAEATTLKEMSLKISAIAETDEYDVYLQPLTGVRIGNHSPTREGVVYRLCQHWKQKGAWPDASVDRPWIEISRPW